MLLPKALQEGDTVGIIAPASPPEMKCLQDALPFFKNLGLNVKLGKHIREVYGYLAGTDEKRLEDFHDMMVDESIKAIIFARGGYGTGRIVADINYDLVRNNPKIIWGYSDITYLHTAIRQKTGLVTFHGPMVASDIADPDFDVLTASSFQQLFSPTTLQYNGDASCLHVLVEGESAGTLVGGNLSLLVNTLGTEFEINTEGKILLIEDIDEPPYRVDALLNQLKLAGKLASTAGIVVGDFANAKPKKEPSLTLDEIFNHYLGDLTCPVMSGFKIGHCFPHFAVPLGVRAILNTKEKTFTVMPGVQAK
ncbi:S66 peptidase family protein [Ornithinibacillus scapharcae]|uniref:S66 peptidase family protein n=1 Tax=Ornithinibacillus scapharcae TaxID=1147159 RepID=UPI000225AB93|nr:LD-carboxypeptidase [Ornithinibacillus scapharcae]